MPSFSHIVFDIPLRVIYIIDWLFVILRICIIIEKSSFIFFLNYRYSIVASC